MVINSKNKNIDKDDSYIQYDSKMISKKKDIEENLSYIISNYPEDYYELFHLYDNNNKNLNLEERDTNKTIDLRKLKYIINLNLKTLNFNGKPISKGIWYYPSFFNHSCIPNCHEFGYGDILIIIAVNDIEKNNELFLNYLMNDLPYDMRQNILKEFYGFDCNCELCNYEKNRFIKCPEKKILNEYNIKLNQNVYNNNIGINDDFKACCKYSNNN